MKNEISPQKYFLFTFGWSVLFWLLSYIFSEDDPSTSILFYIGGAGPFIISVVLTQFRESGTVIRDYWKRIFDPRLISLKWLLPTLFLHPLIIVLAFTIDLSLGGTIPPLSQQLSSLSSILSFLFFVFILGPLPEEIGWRGYAFDRLHARMSALNSSLILGTAWALWHVPLFLIPGTFQAEVMGFGTPRFWIFLYSMVPLSILMTWIYNNTSKSILSAALVHFSGNVLGALLPKTNQVAGLEVLLLTSFAFLIYKRWGLDAIQKT